jgi:hypothetical protein
MSHATGTPANEAAGQADYQVRWPDGGIYSNRYQQTRLTEAEARATARAIGGTWRRLTGQEG